jgi:hypothetical protein
MYFGRSPTGRTIRCNALFVTSQTISAAIPNVSSHCDSQTKQNLVLLQKEIVES